jgi:hypothetical protein
LQGNENRSKICRNVKKPSAKVKGDFHPLLFTADFAENLLALRSAGVYLTPHHLEALQSRKNPHAHIFAMAARLGAKLFCKNSNVVFYDRCSTILAFG